jgi:uncharacterized OB-fold protein
VTDERPLPEPSGVTVPFWDAAAKHKLLIQQCRACGSHQFYPRYNCTKCGSVELDWVEASGRGQIYSYTIARRPTHPAFANEVPFVIAIVDLEEGARMTTNIVGCDPEEVSIGMSVEVTFDDRKKDIALPLFRPEVL